MTTREVYAVERLSWAPRSVDRHRGVGRPGAWHLGAWHLGGWHLGGWPSGGWLPGVWRRD